MGQKNDHYEPHKFEDNEEVWGKLEVKKPKKIPNKKHYTVWVGVKPGVYDNWADTEKQVKGFSGAKFKSFPSKIKAEIAFDNGYERHIAA